MHAEAMLLSESKPVCHSDTNQASPDHAETLCSWLLIALAAAASKAITSTEAEARVAKIKDMLVVSPVCFTRSSWARAIVQPPPFFPHMTILLGAGEYQDPAD